MGSDPAPTPGVPGGSTYIRPMPGFVSDAVRIIAGIREVEPVVASVFLQPGEGARGLEALFQGRAIRRRDVERPAGVVFAVAGGGVDLEDVLDAPALVELPLDEGAL